MMTFAENDLPIIQICVFRDIEKLINKFDEKDLNLSKGEDEKQRSLDCHMLAQALARIDGGEYLYVQSGYYLPGYEHSWLKFKHGCNIIDPYPWGCIGGPQIIDGRIARAHSCDCVRPGKFMGIYQPEPTILCDVLTRNKNFWSDVAEVERALRAVNEGLRQEARRVINANSAN